MVEGFNTLAESGSPRMMWGVPGLHRIQLSASDWQQVSVEMRDQGARLLALWGTEAYAQLPGPAVHALWRLPTALYWVSLPLPEALCYPSLSCDFPTATRMERAIYDLLGFVATGNPDHRSWLRHAAWPAGCFPLRRGQDLGAQLGVDGDGQYPFLSVPGDDIHEIPVGPVHAGSIEPGHFRFSCIGERVVRMEERLGYTHKGIAALFSGKDVGFGLRLAGRVSGDSTVAYAWAFVMAVEQGATLPISERAQFLRALALERERLVNHLGDLGALGNDAGFAFVLTQLLAAKEILLRENEQIFGHRYLMNYVTLGGVERDLTAAQCRTLRQTAQMLRTRLQSLEALLAEHAGLRDRLLSTGTISPQRAQAWGMGGMAGRASGQLWDLRTQLPMLPYERCRNTLAVQQGGDVAARWAQRWSELFASFSLQEDLLQQLPSGPYQTAHDWNGVSAEGLGIVEGWRGEVVIALSVTAGAIQFCHPQDPSTALWPVLEEAVLQDIVADFPLINKSFNLSYSGQDG